MCVYIYTYIFMYIYSYTCIFTFKHKHISTHLYLHQKRCIRRLEHYCTYSIDTANPFEIHHIRSLKFRSTNSILTKFQFVFVPKNTEESEFFDSVEFSRSGDL